MSSHGPGPDFGRDYWEDRYLQRAHDEHDPGRQAPPSPQLVDEVSQLPPGTALEAGCGEGANATWLAQQGWRVTALDVSASALAAAGARAARLGDGVAASISWVEADLLAWAPRTAYDLVTSHYVHTPEPVDRLVARLARAVAPGGTLLVVGHAPDADGSAHGHGVAAAFDPVVAARHLDQEHWLVEVAETRVRAVTGAHGETRLRDGVLRARRTH